MRASRLSTLLLLLAVILLMSSGPQNMMIEARGKSKGKGGGGGGTNRSKPGTTRAKMTAGTFIVVMGSGSETYKSTADKC